MSPASRKEYFHQAHARYSKATYPEKTLILNEICSTLKFNRKYAIRKLKRYQPLSKRVKRNRPERRGRKSVYNHPAIKKPLIEIWLASNLPCSKRLKAILVLWLKSYEESFGKLEDWVKERLLSISCATMDRVMCPTRRRYRGKGRCTTKPGLFLKSHIPIKTNQWNEKLPGFLESDSVAHCGTRIDGHYVNTVNFVDIATSWNEQRAVYGKGHQAVVVQIDDVEKSLPFELRGFDCDNGCEFMNQDVFKYFSDRKRDVQFTRSRAYHKNDNAHVEQKNWTHVRQWLGYRRFEDPKIVGLLNDLYKNEWRLYHNFFMPSVKLVEKERVGSKVLKVHDSPLTPYQRVMNSKHVKNQVKLALKRQMEGLNPFKLKAIINEKIKKIHRLAG